GISTPWRPSYGQRVSPCRSMSNNTRTVASPACTTPKAMRLSCGSRQGATRRAKSAFTIQQLVLTRNYSMKAYLIITGTLFAVLALAHLLRTIVEWPRLVADPWFIIEGPGIGVVAAALCFWAWR